MLAVVVVVQPLVAVVVYDTVAVPAPTPTISPVAAFKLMTLGEFTDHVPFGTGLDTIALLPTHNTEGAMIGAFAGEGFTLTTT